MPSALALSRPGSDPRVWRQMASSGSPGIGPLPARSRATPPLFQRQPECAAPTISEYVERIELKLRPRAAVLERVERHSPVSVDGHDFAINHRLSGHCLASAGDLREARREQIAAPRPEHNIAAAASAPRGIGSRQVWPHSSRRRRRAARARVRQALVR